jgi:hypothetical protein
VKSIAQDTEEPGGEEASNIEAANEKKIAVALWITEEIRFLCGIVQKLVSRGLTEDEHQKALERFKRRKDKNRKSEPFFIEETF